MRAPTSKTRNFAVRGGSIAGTISMTIVSTHGQFTRGRFERRFPAV